MTTNTDTIRNQLDSLPYDPFENYVYEKQASFEPHYLSDDLDAVMRLYKEAGFWGNAWDFTKNLGLSTVGLADDKHQWMNYVTPLAMMAIPGVGLAGGAVRAGVTGLGRLAAGQGLRFLGREAAKGAVKQTAKQVGKNLANQGAKQIVKRRGLNMATGFKSRLPSSQMPTVETWAKNTANPLTNGVYNPASKAPAIVQQAAKPKPSGMAYHLKNMERGAGRRWGSSAWNGMSGGQKALDIARGVLWGGSKNHAVNWGSWAVPQLASQFTDNKYIDNWATARTNLGFMSPGLNRLSGWGARKIPGQMGRFRPAGVMNTPAPAGPRTPVIPSAPSSAPTPMSGQSMPIMNQRYGVPVGQSYSLRADQFFNPRYAKSQFMMNGPRSIMRPGPDLGPSIRYNW